MDNIDRRQRALRAVALSRRHHVPLRYAAFKVDLDEDEVLAETGDAWERVGRDYFALPRDSLPRQMQVLTKDGPEWVETRDSRLASRLGQQDNAVKHYLNTGDPSRLRPMTLHIHGREVQLASDPHVIDRLAAGGEIHLEVYRR
jgi:hypothetical protein